MTDERRGAEIRPCGRCGIADASVLDLDTGGAYHPELAHCITTLRARVGDLERTHFALSAAEYEAASAFYSYGATRGNHQDDGRGPPPGPLTPHIHAMGAFVRRMYLHLTPTAGGTSR